MAFQQHEVLAVHESQSARAMRAAVIAPVLGKPAMSDVREAVRQLTRRWRARFCAIAESPGAPEWMSSALARNCCLNCRPFGVQLAHPSLPCNRSLICPFCYARRRVGWAYLAAIETIKALGGFPITVMTMVQQEQHTGDYGDAADELFRISPLAYMIDPRLRHRDRMRTPVGGFMSCIPAAITQGQERFRVTVTGATLRRVALVAPAQAALPAPDRYREIAPEPAYQEVELTDKRDLSALVGRLLRLPRYFLSGDPDGASAMLRRFEGAKLVTKFGICGRRRKPA